ncbi:hypothetical protein Leryth_014898 [Lithospermum erythrorhizon]|nr:hypothetical protein Leryth_014898 [Lithospermum erythrorhizon]
MSKMSGSDVDLRSSPEKLLKLMISAITKGAPSLEILLKLMVILDTIKEMVQVKKRGKRDCEDNCNTVNGGTSPVPRSWPNTFLKYDNEQHLEMIFP